MLQKKQKINDISDVGFAAYDSKAKSFSCFVEKIGNYLPLSSLFSTFQYEFAYDRIRTADLWCRKRLLSQLCHNQSDPNLSSCSRQNISLSKKFKLTFIRTKLLLRFWLRLIPVRALKTRVGKLIIGLYLPVFEFPLDLHKAWLSSH